MEIIFDWFEQEAKIRGKDILEEFVERCSQGMIRNRCPSLEEIENQMGRPIYEKKLNGKYQR